MKALLGVGMTLVALGHEEEQEGGHYAKRRSRWTAWEGEEMLCSLSIASRRAREEVCRDLPGDVPFGEPFVVRSTRPCGSWKWELAKFCEEGAVSVEASLAESRDGTRQYSFPKAARGPRQDCSSRVVGMFRLPREWFGYRLDSRSVCACLLERCERPGGSLAVAAGESCRASPERRRDAWFEAISRGVDERATRVVPPPLGAIVVHVVVGAAVDGSPLSVVDLVAETTPYVDRVLPNDLVYGSRVIIVAALAESRAEPFKSCLLVHALKDYFIDARNASVVAVRVGETPDDDLVFMAQATFFVPAAAERSDLPAALVARRGGTVLVAGDVLPPRSARFFAAARTPPPNLVVRPSRRPPPPRPGDIPSIDSAAIDMLLS